MHCCRSDSEASQKKDPDPSSHARIDTTKNAQQSLTKGSWLTTCHLPKPSPSSLAALPHSKPIDIMVSATSQACHRCMLRATNNRFPDAYSVVQSLTAQASQSPCPACLGILQEPALQSAVTAIAKLLPTITHASRFKINATIPPAASLIRHRALGLSRVPHTNPVSLREAVKWALCHRLYQLGLHYSHDADLFVNLVYTHPETNADSALVIDPLSNPVNPRKRSRHTQSPSTSTCNVTRVLNSLSDIDFRRAVPVPPSPVKTHVQVAASLASAPLLLAGTYLKTSRIVSQTPWYVDRPQSPSASIQTKTDSHTRTASKRTQVSVEDVVTCGIASVLRSDNITFTAGGREDVDVRMLGSGRPFVVEVLNPCVVPSLITPEHVMRMSSISAKHSKSVTLRDLRVVPKAYFSRMREYESEKQKHYRCVVWVAQPQAVDTLRRKFEVNGGFLLHQKTPFRVLHRRTQAVRQRQVYEASITRIVNPNVFILDLVAQAGTYIKEFVHGDNGRTIPNVAQMLGCDADILQLDVTQISRQGGT